MIIITDYGYAYQPQSKTALDNKTRPVSTYEEMMTNEIIPMIDAKFKTMASRKYRAIACLLMGANQTMRIVMNNFYKFSHYGGFSGTSNYTSEEVVDPATFLDGKFKDGVMVNKQFKGFWLGLGTNETKPFPGSIRSFRFILSKQGIQDVYYESRGAGHEWLTRRRDSQHVASLPFKE